MCWGKTISWLACQVEEHVKTCKALSPNMLIDIVVWWAGTEISGQWGCIPMHICPGAAYRDPTVSVKR